jgi:signal transduction histidine kinase
MLGKINSSMGVLAEKKGLKIITNIAPDLPDTFVGDEQRLRQVLINLVGNAIKFTKEGEIRLDLYRPDLAHCAMQVADTGVGIPKEAQSYVFDSFRQVDTSLTGDHRGTGLGLSIAKQLVELMGGQITLESEVGRGSIFTVLLPMIWEQEKTS